MDREALKSRFFALVSPSLPNEWEVEEALDPLADLSEMEQELVLDQVPVIWHVSHSLCFNFLGYVREALSCLEHGSVHAWVAEILNRYEQHGLRAAQHFMADVERNYVCRVRGSTGATFTEVHARLQHYVHGLAGRSLELMPADQVWTDTATIYLPSELEHPEGAVAAAVLYRMIASYQWGYIHAGTFNPQRSLAGDLPDDGEQSWLALHLEQYASPQLAAHLYHLLETIRVTAILERELPGLMREARSLGYGAATAPAGAGQPALLLALRQWVLGADRPGGYPGLAADLTSLADRSAGAERSLELVKKWYSHVLGNRDGSHALVPLPFQGVLRLEEVHAAQQRRRVHQRQRFVDALAVHLRHLARNDGAHLSRQDEPAGTSARPEGADARLVDGRGDGRRKRARETLLVDNRSVELDDELVRLVQDIREDLGTLPESYVQAASGLAGRGVAGGEGGPAEGEGLDAPLAYDEWDFRRKGFRRNWCLVRERELQTVRSTFLQATIQRYRGQIFKLRQQFELMRTSERFVRRQRDGDDIDLDALVDSLADSRAGLPPSDRLFVRLQRDERDIAAVFLVDMSNSTQGWVGRAIKESLVLICEAMEALGDRYAIYGFSGMRRLRCDVFHVKHLEEPYSEQVRQRIGSINPREYTRMAPAIRYMITRFARVEARVRLLVVLSDGKPEDYDGYKGEYAVEDTRHALLEARSAGLHPFGITIDRHAHDYMAHMYGEYSYIFIDDVQRLPARMPEIYRNLTT